MIDPNKTYKTISNCEWRYYGENGKGQIHGAFKTSDGIWNIGIWKKDGKSFGCKDSPLDIVEVKPRIKRTYWLNIYENPNRYDIHEKRKVVNDTALYDRLACVKVEIDCEIGEGL